MCSVFQRCIPLSVVATSAHGVLGRIVSGKYWWCFRAHTALPIVPWMLQSSSSVCQCGWPTMGSEVTGGAWTINCLSLTMCNHACVCVCVCVCVEVHHYWMWNSLFKSTLRTLVARCCHQPMWSAAQCNQRQLLLWISWGNGKCTVNPVCGLLCRLCWLAACECRVWSAWCGGCSCFSCNTASVCSLT